MKNFFIFSIILLTSSINASYDPLTIHEEDLTDNTTFRKISDLQRKEETTIAQKATKAQQEAQKMSEEAAAALEELSETKTKNQLIAGSIAQMKRAKEEAEEQVGDLQIRLQQLTDEMRLERENTLKTLKAEHAFLICRLNQVIEEIAEIESRQKGTAQSTPLQKLFKSIGRTLTPNQPLELVPMRRSSHDDDTLSRTPPAESLSATALALTPMEEI